MNFSLINSTSLICRRFKFYSSRSYTNLIGVDYYTHNNRSNHPLSTSKSANLNELTINRNITSRSRLAPSDGRFGPSVRLLLHHYGLNWHEVKPSGPHHFLLKKDVLHYIQQNKLEPRRHQTLVHSHQHHKHHDHHRQQHNEQQSAQPQSMQLPINQPKPAFTVTDEESYTDKELTGMRRVIAERLTFSKTNIPHGYMVGNCKVDSLLDMRKVMKSSGITVSVNDFIIKACALALKQVNEVNVEYDQNTETIIPHKNIDISIAVAIKSGLITPIVKSANELNFEQISATVKKLVEKARNGKLLPQEFQGGTFSISNLGMFGISEFTAVINPPQAAILAVGGTKYIPDVVNIGKVNQTISLTLSYDMRAITDETAAKFMECLREYLESPDKMLFVGDGSDQRRLHFLLNNSNN